MNDIEKEEKIGSNEMNTDEDYSLSFGESEEEVEKVPTKESRVAKKDFSYLNNAILELNKKTKDIAVLYITLKQKTERLEKKENELNDVVNELKEIISHIKSERRHHDLTDVDFNEIIRRVEAKINNKKNKDTKKYFSKKSKNIFLKTFLLIGIMALLLIGYAYKINQESSGSENIFKNLLIKIIN